MTDWQALVRNPDLSIAGPIEYTSLQLVPRYNAIGSWAIDIPFNGDFSSRAARLLLPGAGLIVVVNGKPVMSGPVTKPDRSQDGDVGHLAIGGTDDLISLQDRVAHQDPANADTPQPDSTYTQAEDDQTGPAETVIKHWVDANAGLAAIGAREGLTVETDAGRGSTIHWSGRMQNLLVLLINQATAGGIGINVVQSGTSRIFKVYVPADRTRAVVFAVELGNVQAFSYGADRPTANVAYVGGSGVGAARVFRIVQDAPSVAQWGRIETFVDQGDTNVAGKLDQAGRVALASTAAQYRFSATAVETGTHAWAPLASSSQEPYNVGDRVSVSVDGATTTEVIRELSVTNTAQGTTVEPSIGSTGIPEKRLYEQLEAEIRSLRAQVRDLQRR